MQRRGLFVPTLLVVLAAHSGCEQVTGGGQGPVTGPGASDATADAGASSPSRLDDTSATPNSSPDAFTPGGSEDAGPGAGAADAANTSGHPAVASAQDGGATAPDEYCAPLCFNQQCPGAYDFCVTSYGACAEVPCTDHGDCCDLALCDKAGTAVSDFYCDTGKCRRDKASEYPGLCGGTTTAWPECDPSSVCCDGGGRYVGANQHGNGCTSDCRRCNGHGSCSPVADESPCPDGKCYAGVCLDVHSSATCDPCDADLDCEGERCLSWVDFPSVKWCSHGCATDADCGDMTNASCVDVDGTPACVPGQTKECSGATAVMIDGCAHTLSETTCPDGCKGGACVTPGSCVGSAASCSSKITASGCSHQVGCSWGGDCGGSATSCYSYFSSANCSSQDGCYYSGSYPNGSCSGSANSCGYYSSEYSCESQDGCHWDKGCGGSAKGCSSLSTEASCEDQSGCSWK